MACNLMRAGVKVAGVVLIDSPSPFTQKPLPEALIEAVLETETIGANEHQANLVRLARIQMTHSTNTLVAYTPPSQSDFPELPNVAMIRCAEGFPFSEMSGIGKSQRLSFLEDRKDPRDLVRDWERLVGKDVPVFDIPGHHFEVFSPTNVSTPFLLHSPIVPDLILLLVSFSHRATQQSDLPPRVVVINPRPFMHPLQTVSFSCF